MKWRLHPLLACWLLLLFLSGQLANYSLLLLTLVVHELGHIIVAKLMRVPLAECTIAPYGGEIRYVKPYNVTAKQHCFIALGGPVATIALLVACHYSPSYYTTQLYEMQLYLLVFNAIPAYPLDGGRILYYGFMIFYPKIIFFERFLSLSCCFLTIIFIATLFHLPHAMPISGLLLFLLVRNYNEWRAQKYINAFEKIVLNRLT